MYRNRIVYGGLWLLGVILLLFLPGFECRGLAMGMLVGHLPFIGLALFGIRPEYQHPLFTLLSMALLSGGFVALAAWVMDRSRRFALYCVLLALGIPVGVGYTVSRGFDYEGWKHSAPVQQAMESPEVNYQPTRADYNREIAIPRAVAGGLLGLYLAAAAGGLLACTMLLKRRPAAAKLPCEPQSGEQEAARRE